MKLLTIADFDLACERLDKIWSARPGDSEWTERSEIIDALDEYEAQNGSHFRP